MVGTLRFAHPTSPMISIRFELRKRCTSRGAPDSAAYPANPTRTGLSRLICASSSFGGGRAAADGGAGGSTAIGGFLGQAELAQPRGLFADELRVHLELRHHLGSGFLTLLLESIGHCQSSFGAAALRDRSRLPADHAFPAAQSRGGCATTLPPGAFLTPMVAAMPGPTGWRLAANAPAPPGAGVPEPCYFSAGRPWTGGNECEA